MTTLTLLLALTLTAGSVLLTSVLASRYGIGDGLLFEIDPTHAGRPA